MKVSARFNAFMHPAELQMNSFIGVSDHLLSSECTLIYNHQL